MSKTLCLIDGHSHIYSAFYAIRGLTTPDGRPINAVYGFTAMLHKILRRQPDYIAVVLDAGEKTFRNDLFEEYKATRKPMPDELVSQLPLIDQVIEAHGIRMVKQAGFEADDIIATLARQAEKKGFDVHILTTDKDAQQLLGQAQLYQQQMQGIMGQKELLNMQLTEIDKALEALDAETATEEQVDAIRSMGADPVQKLVLPRVLAATLALPLLTVLADIVGVLGGMLIATTQFGISANFYLDTLYTTVTVEDLLSGISKTFVLCDPNIF